MCYLAKKPPMTYLQRQAFERRRAGMWQMNVFGLRREEGLPDEKYEKGDGAHLRGVRGLGNAR